MKTRFGFLHGRLTLAAVLPLLLMTARTLDAHHSATRFDMTVAVSVRGTILRFDRSNPHSYLYVEQQTPDRTLQWAIEGPGPLQLDRRNLDTSQLEPGRTVEACGYRLKADGPAADGAAPRLLLTELLEMPDGLARVWSDYGGRHCREMGAYRVAGD